MKPYLVKFHVYADDESQVQELQNSLFDLVNTLYGDGIYVNAPRLSSLIRNAIHNPILKQLLK